MQNLNDTLLEMLVVDKGERARSVRADDNFIAMLGMDSFDIVRLIVEIEEKYDVELFDSAHDHASLNTLGELAALVQQLIDEKG